MRKAAVALTPVASVMAVHSAMDVALPLNQN